MANASVVRVVLIPRYTAMYGTFPFYTAPLNVRDFASALLTVWSSQGLGSPAATVSFQVQTSADLDIWKDSGSPLTPAADSESSGTLDFALDWIRLKVSVTTAGSYPGLTTWCVMALVPREKGRAGEAA